MPSKNYPETDRTNQTTNSIQPLRRGKRENKRKKKTSERAAHFLQVSLPSFHAQQISSNFNLYDSLFINGDRRDFDIGREYPYRGSYLQFSRDFYFQSVCVTAMQILAIVCSKDYLHVVITIKVAKFSNQSFTTNTCALLLRHTE